MQQNMVGGRALPGPAGGGYALSHDGGPTSKGREERGDKEGKERRGKREIGS